MDNNSTNNKDNINSGSYSENDIDDVLKIMHKKKQIKEPAQSDSTVIDMDAVKKQSPEQLPLTEISPDATRINMDPVKPVIKKPVTQREPLVSSGSATPPQKPSIQARSTAGVSLDDFNAETTVNKAKNNNKFFVSGKLGFFKLGAYIACIVIISVLLANFIINVGNDVFAFNKNGKGTLLEEENVTVFIPEDASTAEIAKILHKAGIIKYPTVFKMYASFRISKRSYLTGDYLSGNQTVNQMMNYDTLINVLADYPRSSSGTVRITIPEGLTVKEILEIFEKNGVGKAKDYTEALQNFEYNYEFAKLLTKDSISEYRFDTDMSYRLEGYLFPDTYDFYLNENPVSAINKLLVNFNKKFEEDFYERCKELNMTVDQVITLASLIEKEGNNSSDYYYISSVFHNRLKNSAAFPFLNSDATLQYALEKRVGAYDVNTSLDHPYNTYVYKGLPPGPICNPGIEAIYAALYPEKTNYYYFYTKKNGITVYSTTYEQHQSYVYADR